MGAGWGEKEGLQDLGEAGSPDLKCWGDAWSLWRKKLPSGGRRHLGVARTGWSLAWGLALRVCGSLWRMNCGRPISLEEGVSQFLHASPPHRAFGDLGIHSPVTFFPHPSAAALRSPRLQTPLRTSSLSACGF